MRICDVMGVSRTPDQRIADRRVGRRTPRRPRLSAGPGGGMHAPRRFASFTGSARHHTHPTVTLTANRWRAVLTADRHACARCDQRHLMRHPLDAVEGQYPRTSRRGGAQMRRAVTIRRRRLRSPSTPAWPRVIGRGTQEPAGYQAYASRRLPIPRRHDRGTPSPTRPKRRMTGYSSFRRSQIHAGCEPGGRRGCAVGAHTSGGLHIRYPDPSARGAAPHTRVQTPARRLLPP
jgi:hypothetical protein